MTHKEYPTISYELFLSRKDAQILEEIQEKEIEEICDRIEKILKKEVKNDE